MWRAQGSSGLAARPRSRRARSLCTPWQRPRAPGCRAHAAGRRSAAAVALGGHRATGSRGPGRRCRKEAPCGRGPAA
eukprot:7925525-Lingulodinium_polyedra.AAC.1